MGNNVNKTPNHSLKEQLNANSVAYKFKQVYPQAKQKPKAKTKKQSNRNLQIKTHRIHRYDEDSKLMQNSKQFAKLSTPLQISPISSIKTSRNMNTNFNHNFNNNTNIGLKPLRINGLHTQKQLNSIWWLSFREKLSQGTTLVCPALNEKYLVHYLIFNSFAEYEHFTDTVIYRMKALHSCHKAKKYLNPISAIYGEKVQTIQCGCGDTGQNDRFCQQYRVYIVENYMHQSLDSFLESYSLSYSHLLGILYSFVVVMAAYQYKRLRFGSIDFNHVFIQKIKQHQKNTRSKSVWLNTSQIQQNKHKSSNTNDQINLPQKLQYVCKVSDPYIKDFINQSQHQLQNGKKSSVTSTSPLNGDVYKSNVLEVGKIVEEYLSFKSIHKDFINIQAENADQQMRAQAVLQRLVRNHMICDNRQKDHMTNKNEQNNERYNWLQIQRYLQQEYYNKNNHNGKNLKKTTKQMQFYSINNIKPPSTPHGNHTALYSIPGPNPNIVYNPAHNHEYHSVDARFRNVQYKAKSLEKQPTGNSLKHLHQPINGTHFNIYSQQPTQTVLGQKVQQNVLKILNGKKTSRVNNNNNKTNGSFNKQNMPNISNTIPTNSYINLKPSRRNDTKNSQMPHNQALPQNQPSNLNLNITPMAMPMPTCSNTPTVPPLQNNINIQNLNIQTTNYNQNHNPNPYPNPYPNHNHNHNHNQSSAHLSNNNNNSNNNNTNASNNGGSNSKNSSANKYLNHHNIATNQHMPTSFVHTLNTLNSQPMSVLYNQRDPNININVIGNNSNNSSNNRERLLPTLQPVTPQNSGYGIIENPSPEQLPQSTKIQYKNLYNIGKYWSKFQGNFHNGCKEGPGTIYLTNGHIFNGYFQDDVANGRGEVYVDGQAVVRGYWSNNLFVTQY